MIQTESSDEHHRRDPRLDAGQADLELEAATVTLAPGSRIGPYEVLSAIGAGGPASVRGRDVARELRRGLAEAQKRTRRT